MIYGVTYASRVALEYNIRNCEVVVRVVDTYTEELFVAGAVVVLIGTLSTAYGQTNFTVTSIEEWKRFIIKGNGIEAFGNTLQAIARDKESVHGGERQTQGITGSWLQAGGNATNAVATNLELAGALIDGQKLNVFGSGIQSFGAALEANATLVLMENDLEVLGYGASSIGALLDSIGTFFVLKGSEQRGNHILMIASWIQVIGAILVVVGLVGIQ
ncbi:hypothetical protein ABN702_15195 [Bacillus haimaensis]|uniref:DUF6944 family repetitive protein n=1 Tax=Bacillus haimaensis TaxID=3160967 RepID=UPI003AA8D3B5